jgi:Protein of unknown function (DUF3987)
LRRLEITARDSNEAEKKNYATCLEFHKLQKEDAQKKVRRSLADGSANASSLSIDAPEAPKDKRYIVNDVSYEKLGEVLADNPNGVLAYRDELISLLKTLDREEYIATRGFYLSAWSGKDSYTFDRIIRGQTYIKAACVSMLGSTQPGKLAGYMQTANSNGEGDDGLIQRFGLLVWPDQTPEWREADRYAQTEPKSIAWQTFERLNELTAEAAGAQLDDEYEKLPFLRFDEEAQPIFSDWRSKLEIRLRSGELTPALESHLAKYRKLIPTLALINHLADGGTRAIGETALLRALAFARYLETHARRAYGTGTDPSVAAANAILKHIRFGDLQNGFTGRDAQRSQWSNLPNSRHIQAGLDLLAEFNWLRGERKETGGRPIVAYQINPAALK